MPPTPTPLVWLITAAAAVATAVAAAAPPLLPGLLTPEAPFEPLRRVGVVLRELLVVGGADTDPSRNTTRAVGLPFWLGIKPFIERLLPALLPLPLPGAVADGAPVVAASLLAEVSPADDVGRPPPGLPPPPPPLDCCGVGLRPLSGRPGLARTCRWCCAVCCAICCATC